MSFTSLQYEQLASLLNYYRSNHQLDRAAKNALSLLSSEVENARLKHEKDNVSSIEKLSYISSKDIPIKDIEDIINRYNIEPSWNASDIIHILAKDGHINANDANHYYRALVAAQSVIDSVNS